MLTFNLKKQWYEKIRSGEKTIEYREIKPYWSQRVYNEARFSQEQKEAPIGNLACILRLGYTKKYMTAVISKIEAVDGKNTDLAIDKPVYAFHLTNIKEV